MQIIAFQLSSYKSVFTRPHAVSLDITGDEAMYPLRCSIREFLRIGISVSGWLGTTYSIAGIKISSLRTAQVIFVTQYCIIMGVTPYLLIISSPALVTK